MVKTVALPQTISEYFGLRKSQAELEFLDIYANQDIALFLDPFGISAMGTKWSKDCEVQIATYFQYLVDSIKSGDKKMVTKLLATLGEVNEVGLGYSQNASEGRGIGTKQAKEIQDAFEHSEAAKSGDIKDLADCALLIPGINRDKISDITANILKKNLIEFTKKQCKKHSIPLTKVPVSAFDYSTFTFKSYYDTLPVVNGRPKILLPVSSVRQDPELSKDKYYRNFVLEYLKAEHSHAGDSLSTVLKNGKVLVRIADLKAEYPMGADFLYQFSKSHPQVLDKYKNELRRTAIATGDRPKLVTPRKVLSGKERIAIVDDIKPGNDDAHRFHKIAYESLIHIFGARLLNPNREREINEGRKRIDIVFDNSGERDFFGNLNSLHHIHCPKIIVECKNYGSEIGNPEIDQLQGRFSNQRGRFGILLCRSIQNKKALVQKCKDVIRDHNGYVIVMEDKDLRELLHLKDLGDEKKIDQFMSNKLDEIIM